MTSICKAVVQLRRTSGVSADTINNDFYFALDPDEVTSTLADGLRTSLASFYNDVHAPGTADLASFIGTDVSRSANAHSISFYSVEDPWTAPIVWGSPKQVRSFTLDAAAAGNNLPGEVAVVLTYHADLTDIPETQTNPSPPPAVIRPASRRRGRLYIGPLRTNALSEQSPNFEPFPNVGLVNAMCGAADNLQATSPVDTTWAVLSQADETERPVIGGWVDNAFDSQRRRGNESSSRTLWG